jgi:hypothetical protein
MMRSRRIFRLIAVIVLMGFAVAACAQKATVLHQGPLSLPNGHVIERADVRLHDRTLEFLYKTAQQIRNNCRSIQAEVRELWESYVRAAADRVNARSAKIGAEDSASASVGFFVFTRGAEGHWDHGQFGVCETD